MTPFLIYNLKVGVCLAIFYLFFKLLLSRDTFHRFNRIILLSVTVVSFALPLCVITVHRELPATVITVPEYMVEVIPEPPAVVAAPSVPAEVYVEIPGSGGKSLSILFAAGVAGSVMLTLFSIVRIVRIIRRGEHERIDRRATLVRKRENIAPFSWLKYIVVSFRDYEDNGPEIIAHERAHIYLRHSLDLLAVDILGCLQWFNPAMWLLRQELRAIHEYEADRAVLNNGVDPKAYQLLLIKKAVGIRSYSIANSLNHSKLKNRITMMLQKNSPSWAKAKALLALPLVCFGLMAFATTEYSSPPEGKVMQKNTKTITVTSEGDDITVLTSTSDGITSDSKLQVLVFGEKEEDVATLAAAQGPDGKRPIAYSARVYNVKDNSGGISETASSGEKMSRMSLDANSAGNRVDSVKYFLVLAPVKATSDTDTLQMRQIITILRGVGSVSDSLVTTIELMSRELYAGITGFDMNVKPSGKGPDEARINITGNMTVTDPRSAINTSVISDWGFPKDPGSFSSVNMSTGEDGKKYLIVKDNAGKETRHALPDITVNEDGKQVVVKRVKTVSASEGARSIEISVNKKGRIMISGEVMTIEDVAARITDIAAASGVPVKNYEVTVLADPAVEYGLLSDLNSRLEEAGVSRINLRKSDDSKFK